MNEEEKYFGRDEWGVNVQSFDSNFDWILYKHTFVSEDAERRLFF